ESAMTKRNLPTQVLTILPCCLSASYVVKGLGSGRPMPQPAPCMLGPEVGMAQMMRAVLSRLGNDRDFDRPPGQQAANPGRARESGESCGADRARCAVWLDHTRRHPYCRPRPHR